MERRWYHWKECNDWKMVPNLGMDGIKERREGTDRSDSGRQTIDWTGEKEWND